MATGGVHHILPTAVPSAVVGQANAYLETGFKETGQVYAFQDITEASEQVVRGVMYSLELRGTLDGEGVDFTLRLWHDIDDSIKCLDCHMRKDGESDVPCFPEEADVDV